MGGLETGGQLLDRIQVARQRMLREPDVDDRCHRLSMTTPPRPHIS
jgi:hypothetical protein